MLHGAYACFVSNRVHVLCCGLASMFFNGDTKKMKDQGTNKKHAARPQHSICTQVEQLFIFFALVQATQDTAYLDAGAAMIESLFSLNWVEGGWASVQSVHTKQLEDHMPSYFLAEACKYLYLLFDDSFLQVWAYTLWHMMTDLCRSVHVLVTFIQCLLAL